MDHLEPSLVGLMSPEQTYYLKDMKRTLKKNQMMIHNFLPALEFTQKLKGKEGTKENGYMTKVNPA